jgi:hypothetical protein
MKRKGGSEKETRERQRDIIRERERE